MSPLVAGIDCGKSSVYVCSLEEHPANLKNFCRSYKPLVLKSKREDIEVLLALPADLFVLEPTGSYSRIWIDTLVKAGRQVRLVNPRRIRNYAQYQGIVNKADKPDAAVIAAYSLVNYNNSEAFLSADRIAIRDKYLNLISTTKNKNPIFNRLGQRLEFECPEFVDSYESSRRGWLEPVPTLLRFLAGEGYGGRGRQEKLETTIGLGLSEHSRELARELINLELIELRLEKDLAPELLCPEYDPYHRALDLFKVPQIHRAAIISQIYPFQDFLSEDGKPIREYVHGEHSKRRSGKTKRDRSCAGFKLSLGMGKVLSQSGQKTEWKAGGSRYARTALWQYIKIMIVIPRGKMKFTEVAESLEAEYRIPKVSPWLNERLIRAIADRYSITPQMARLFLHFEFTVDKKGDRKVCATAGQFCRMLYKELLREIVGD